MPPKLRMKLSRVRLNCWHRTPTWGAGLMAKYESWSSRMGAQGTLRCIVTFLRLAKFAYWLSATSVNWITRYSPPLYGTSSSDICVIRCSNAVVRCCELPKPAVP